MFLGYPVRNIGQDLESVFSADVSSCVMGCFGKVSKAQQDIAIMEDEADQDGQDWSDASR